MEEKRRWRIKWCIPKNTLSDIYHQAICPWWTSQWYGCHIPETWLLEAVWFYETSNKTPNKWLWSSCSGLRPLKQAHCLACKLFYKFNFTIILLLIFTAVLKSKSQTFSDIVKHMNNYAWIYNFTLYSFSKHVSRNVQSEMWSINFIRLHQAVLYLNDGQRGHFHVSVASNNVWSSFRNNL